MGDLLSGIFDFLGSSVVSALETFVIWLYQLIIVIFQVLWQVIVAIGNAIVSAVKAIGRFFDHIWNQFIKKIWANHFQGLKDAWKWLEKKLSKFLDFLTKLRKWLDRYYKLHIRPILQLIQHIRQYLQILSLLHIGIAQKLDNYLAQIQAKITQAFATVVATVNTLTDVVNALMDPTYLLRKPALLLSIRRQIPALIRVLTGRPPGYWFPSPKGSSGGVFSPPKFPFNFADPAQNPAASTLLSNDDGIGEFSVFVNAFTLGDGAADQARPLDYFNDDLYPATLCPYGDPAKCLLYSWGIKSE